MSRGESMLLHCVGGCMLSSVLRGSKAPGSKYLPRKRQKSNMLGFGWTSKDQAGRNPLFEQAVHKRSLQVMIGAELEFD